ncbi:reverse transcriptase [Phytophthora megakarya]|uniref:Reverse transcriptase n=1 Tax=Phytophthora megakarya TaxID=4795 RepID=A0A225WCN8_9STRA|nr:reverse transcriptase [Phytophthora megakarya]
MGSVLGRSSYIDDIAHGAPTWDKLCEDLDALLFRLRYWNISVSLPKSEFGKQAIPYMSHEVCAEGIRATPKIAKSVQDLPFPSTLKGDLPVVAAVLYELDEDRIRACHDLDKAKEAFEILKRKITSTPLLRHPDCTKPFVIISHANPWAACAVLGQEHQGIIQPVRFTGRILNESELRYHIAEKEALAILRVLEQFRPPIYGSETPTVIYTRYSVLKILPTAFTSVGFRIVEVTLELRRVQRDEDGLAAILGAGITPREHLDEVAENLIPAKGRVKAPPPISVEMLDSNFEGYVDVVVVSDSRIVIQQAQGLIGCHQPNLQRRLAEYEALKVKFGSVRLVHVKRDYNQAADYLTTKTLALGKAWVVEDADELMHLKFVSRIPEKIMKTPETSLKGDRPSDLLSDSAPSTPETAIPVNLVTTRSRSRQVAQVDDPGRPLDYRDERWRRIKVHQDEDPELKRLKVYLKGDLLHYTRREVKKIAKGSDRYVLDSRDVLYRLAAPSLERPRNKCFELRLVVPVPLRPDILHHAHEDFQSGHQGITRTYERQRSEFFWIGMFQDVKIFVKEYTDCASAKGRPPNPGPSPGNIEWTGPFDVMSMDFIIHLPKPERGNTFLLLFQDMLTGYVMCKPMSSTTTQDCAEAYEEVVFRNYGASFEIQHDRDPRIINRVFGRFSETMGTQQKATLAYRPQANGQHERSGQTIMHSIRAYVEEPDQTDWDDYAEKLMHAMNTSFDATRLDTPFYLLHGFDCRSTIAAMLGPKPTNITEQELQKKTKRTRSAVQTQKWKIMSEHLKSGFEVRNDFKVKLKVQDTGYRVEPCVHISRLKPRALFPKRPSLRIDVSEEDAFDAALLPEDSWESDSAYQEYKVEEIVDLR